MATILQSELLVNFLYPLLLMFFITYGVLEKTKILGDGKQQLNAGVALVVGLIFVGAVFPKIVVANLIQFMTIGLVIIFIGLMLWGFLNGTSNGIRVKDKGIHKMFAFLIIGATFFAILWATGFGGSIIGFFENLFNSLFSSDWSSAFWTNVITIGIIFVAVAVVTGWKPKNTFNWWIK